MLWSAQDHGDKSLAARQQLFNARTDINRQEKQAEAAANAVDLPPGKEPAEIDVRAKAEELAAAHRRNQAKADVRQERAAQDLRTQSEAKTVALNFRFPLRRVDPDRDGSTGHRLSADRDLFDVQHFVANFAKTCDDRGLFQFHRPVVEGVLAAKIILDAFKNV